jgi:hypothetical protein
MTRVIRQSSENTANITRIAIKGDKGDIGAQGVKGDIGYTGSVGPQGLQGIQGPIGNDGPQGVKGDRGDSGTSIRIIGSVQDPSYLPLNADFIGDSYICDSDGDLYNWTGSMFVSVGQIVGPEGPQGLQGPIGLQGIEGPQGIQGVPGADGGSLYIEDLKNSAIPNETRPIISISAKSSNAEADIDIAIVPKGNGSFSLQVADETIANGNKRGVGSIDLQRVRTSADMVAAGENCFIYGKNNKMFPACYNSLMFGENNIQYKNSVFTIGNNNQVSSNFNPSFVIGEYNTFDNLNNDSIYVFGKSNSFSGIYSYSNIYIFGHFNTIYNQTTSIIHLGFYNSIGATGVMNSLTFGSSNVLKSKHACLIGNKGCDKGVNGAITFGSILGNTGSIQEGKYVMSITTTAIGSHSLVTYSGALSTSNTPTLQNNEVRVFKGLIVAKDSDNTGSIASWKIEGCIARFSTAASTIFIGTPTITTIGESASSITNGYSLSIVANTTVGGLQVLFAYTGGGVVKVVGTIDMTECI